MTELMEKLEKEASEVRLKSFTNEDARILGNTIIDRVRSCFTKGIAIRIEKNHVCVFSALMDNAMPENLYWADRKKNVVDRYDKSSMYVGELFRSKGKIFERDGLLDPKFYQATGGAVPIEVEGFGVVGTIVVSGLTSEDDHDLCIYGLKRLKELKNE